MGEYRKVLPIDRPTLERLFESGNENAICEALLSGSFYEPDWRWVQAQCLRFLDHPVLNVRCNAVISLGHIARVSRQMDVELVLPKLNELKKDTKILPWVDDAIDDIRFFLKFN